MATQSLFRGTTTFGAPSAGDSFYVQEGSQLITGNVDYSAVNSSVLCEIAKLFTGDIGTPADPWQTAFSSRLVFMGSGSVYFESDAADTETTALVQCLGTGSFNFLNAGIVTRFEAIAGRQSVGNGAVITTGRFGGGANYSLLDTGTATAVTTLDCFGGIGYSRRPHTTINGLGGMLSLDADSAGGVNAHTTINAFGTAFTLRDSGTITTLNWYSGKFDASPLSRPLTITNTTINMSLPGAQALLDHPLITFTNTPTRLMTDGRQV